MKILGSATTKFIFAMLALLFVAVAIFMMRGGSVDNRHGAAAIIDLDKVATATGRSELISSRVSAFISDEEEKLNVFKQALIAEIEQEKQAMSENPSEEQAQNLAVLTQNSNRQLQQSATNIQNSTEQLKVQLVYEFRNEVEPIVRQVAEKRKFDLVEIKSPGYIYINSEVDISDDVIDRLLMLKSSVKDELISE